MDGRVKRNIYERKIIKNNTKTWQIMIPCFSLSDKVNFGISFMVNHHH